MLTLAVLFQIFMVTRTPSNLGMEALLAARALHQGLLPYRDFAIHIGPVPVAIFYFLPSSVFIGALVYVGFNLTTAVGLYKISKRTLPAILFLIICPFFGGNEMFTESICACFGVWAFYFAQIHERISMWVFLLLAVLTKQTGIFYAIGLYRSILFLDS